MLYPLPAVMVSCQKPGESPNIITVAWTGTVCSDPAMVYISVRPSRFSYDVIRSTKEFVINLTDEKLVRSMDLCGVKSGRDIDKFAACGLSAVPSLTVGAPSIGESPVCIECRVTQMIELGSHVMFLANVSAVTVDASLLDQNGTFHLDQAGLIAYSHGAYYALGSCLGKFGYSVRKTGKGASGNGNRKTQKTRANHTTSTNYTTRIKQSRRTKKKAYTERKHS